MTDPNASIPQGPPGQTENGSYNAAAHMPPPSLPPLNTNPIPSAVGPGGPPPSTGGITSPVSAGGTVRRAAPEPNHRTLYVGGLHPDVQEVLLKQIFETMGPVVSVKIIPDKAFATKGFNYGFVEYDDPTVAERAMNTLHGRQVQGNDIRVNYAYQSNSATKEDTSNHYHIFVGDLSNEVNDEVLQQAFQSYGHVSEGRVMWDMKTGRSRGYGFVAFRDRGEAEKALARMDGEWLGSRAIRCNWANQKGQPSISQQQAMASMGLTPTSQFGHHQFPTHGAGSYQTVASQTPDWQTTCYVGNLTPYTTPGDVVPLFQNFGMVTEQRFSADRGFAFIKLDSHDKAAMAICQLNGYVVNGRPLKCSWGKDRPPTGQFDGYSPQTPGFGTAPQPFFPQYGGPGGPAMSPQAPSPQYGQGYPSYQGMPPNAGGFGRGGHGGNPSYSSGPNQYGYSGYPS
ncbi:MAG: hypothetical protein M1831_004331 [Alyxoria varia]|nr:MAG: hypothetical protein M1831_004331 [Alyxoria varia]